MLMVIVEPLRASDIIRPVCERLEWDSRFFNRKIGRVLGSDLCPERLESIDSWARQEGIDCLYLLVPGEDKATRAIAEDAGFVMVDERVTLERLTQSPLPAPETAAIVRLFEQRDLEELVAIARISHKDSRFYHDENFPRERCADLYETWLRKSCDGWADAVWVAKLDGRAVGYLSCHLEADGKGRIGLVAVDSRYSRLGIGRALQNAALSWFTQKEVSGVFVITQGRNLDAIQFYEKCGFCINSRAFWFHKWFRQ